MASQTHTQQNRSALDPLESLIRKSEKARQRLAPGAWQHRMLGDNLAALRLALALIDHDATPPSVPSPDALAAAHQALASMLAKTATALAKFPPGTAQHSLLANRLQALNLAQRAIQTAPTGH